MKFFGLPCTFAGCPSPQRPCRIQSGPKDGNARPGVIWVDINTIDKDNIAILEFENAISEKNEVKILKRKNVVGEIQVF
jgi:hypothetical protein